MYREVVGYGFIIHELIFLYVAAAIAGMYVEGVSKFVMHHLNFNFVRPTELTSRRFLT